jgi:hypothetical protein
MGNRTLIVRRYINHSSVIHACKSQHLGSRGRKIKAILGYRARSCLKKKENKLKSGKKKKEREKITLN